MGRPGRFGDATQDLLRTTVLQALDELVQEQPWRSISMTKLATAAGVSRQTLYNEFGSRDDLAQTYGLWAASDFLDQIEGTVAAHADDLEAALVSAFQLFLDIAGEHPLVRALSAAGGADDLRSLVATPAGVPIVTTAVDRLAQIVSDTWPSLPEHHVSAVAEILVRMAISHMTVPTISSEQAAKDLGTVIGPFLATLTRSPPDPHRRRGASPSASGPRRANLA